MYLVEFKNVGRDKISWAQKFPRNPSLSMLERAVLKSGALMSRDIQCLSNQDGTAGHIYAGMHCVGAFEVLPPGPSFVEQM